MTMRRNLDPVEDFRHVVSENIRKIGEDRDFIGLTNIWVRELIRHAYAQNFTWLGRPVIQVPQDIYAAQELIWACRPDLIIETGIAHGGSLVLSASMLALLDYCDAIELGSVLDPKASRRKVVGVDVDIRTHNRAAIDAHPMRHKIHALQGSSVAPDIMRQIVTHAEGYDRIMVFLDFNHTHDHVLAELEFYAPFVSKGSYCVAWDTGVEDLPEEMCADRPWGKGNNPKTAVREYMARLRDEGRKGRDGKDLRFEYDHVIEHKISITASPDGFLKRA